MSRPPHPSVSATSASTERLHREMGRWRRRSIVIRFWRGALPIAIGLIVVGVGGWIAGRTLFAPKRVQPADQSIRMVNPRFYGRDRSGKPYIIVADAAVRDSRNPHMVALTKPHMTEGLDTPPPTKVDADTGLYNETTKMLQLDGNVRLDNGKGTIFTSPTALVDTTAGVVHGPTPVVGDGPLGHITASSYAVYDQGRHVVFTGSVKTHLVNK